MKIVFVVENIFVLSAQRIPFPPPNDSRSLIDKRPAEVAMIKNHVRCRGIASIDNLVMDPDNRLTESGGDDSLQFEVGSENGRLFHGG